MEALLNSSYRPILRASASGGWKRGQSAVVSAPQRRSFWAAAWRQAASTVTDWDPPSSSSQTPPSGRTVRSFSSVKVQKIPPNLFIDKRSRYAPVRKSRLLEKLRDEEDQEEEARARADKEEEEEAAGDDTEEDDEGEFLDEEEDEEDEDFFVLNQRKPVFTVPLPDRLHVPVYSLFDPPGENQVGTLWLHQAVFGREPIRVDLMKRAVNYYRAKKRGKRLVKVKTVSEVRGSGRKLRPQKGQGRARVGHGRAPQFRGGARAHGPRGLTDYGKTKLNHKTRRLALSHALSQKLLEGNLIIVDQLHTIPTAKTRDLARYLEAWRLGGREGLTALFSDAYFPEEGEEAQNDDGIIQAHGGFPVNFWCAVKNIHRIDALNHKHLSCYTILKQRKLILTLAAVEYLERRIKNHD